MSDRLLSAAAPAVVAATDDRAWLRAMLDAEAALARAGAGAGLVPPAAARAITEAAGADRYDPADIAARAVDSATPVIPLLADLRAALPPAARPYLHLGATSQDIVDSALSLVAFRATSSIVDDVVAAGDRLVVLAQQHVGTVHIGRTLLQQAAPTTFGAVCAGWLTGLDEAIHDLRRVRLRRLAAQLGGPVGTLAAYGDRGREVLSRYAEELGLVDPRVPWHTNRVRVAELAGALGTVAGSLGTVALDITLLAQTEVGEVAEGRPGGSSAMPHKRNPARAVQVNALVHRVPGAVATILAGMSQEYQRAAGRWQAEWATVTELLRLVGGAAWHARAMLDGLVVDADRMRANLDASGGVLLADQVRQALVGPLGPDAAGSAVSAAVAGTRSGRPLRVALTEQPAVAAALAGGELRPTDLDAALDPARHLGSAVLFTSIAVRHHAGLEDRPGPPRGEQPGPDRDIVASYRSPAPDAWPEGA